jgi:hypothetical protein
MHMPDDKTKTERRAGGRKMRKGKSSQFNFRASPKFLASLAAASDGLGVGRTTLIERALAAFAPEYFAAEASGDSSPGHCAKYARQQFPERSGGNQPKVVARPSDPEAKRKGADRRGRNEASED